MKKYNRIIIAILCILIIAIRIIFPTINFDVISLTLLAIAILVIIIPDEIIYRTKKVKFGSLEIELQEMYKTAEKIEEKLTEKERDEGLSGPDELPESKYFIQDDFASEILQFSIDIESSLKSIYEKAFKTRDKRPVSVIQLVSILNEKNVIDKETATLLQKFWWVRNEVVHSNKVMITESEHLSFIDIAIHILKILKTIQNNLSDGGYDIEVLT